MLSITISPSALWCNLTKWDHDDGASQELFKSQFEIDKGRYEHIAIAE